MKMTHLLLTVGGGGEARQAEYIALALTPAAIDQLLARMDRTAAIKAADGSAHSVTYFGEWGDWLRYSERLEGLLKRREVAVLDRRARGRKAAVECRCLKIGPDWAVFTAATEGADGAPEMESAELSRALLLELKLRLSNQQPPAPR